MRPSTVYVLFNLMMGLGMGFTSTCYAPYVLSVGVTMPQIALINAVFFAVIVLFELPTGMLADGRSRAWSVRLGALIGALGHFAYALIGGFWGAVICEIVIGISCAFLSGALEAWAADAVGSDGETLRRTYGGGAMALSIGCLVGGTVGALVSSYELRYGFYLSGAAWLLAFIVAWWLMGEDGEPAERTTEFVALGNSITALKRGNGLRWVLIAYAAGGLVLSFNHYWAPFFRERVGQAGLSFVWPAVYSGCAVGSYAVRRWAKCHGHESFAVVMSLVTIGTGMACIGLVGGLVAPLCFAFLHEIGRGAFKPLIEAYVQRRVESSYRATYGSLQSLVGRVGFAVILAVVWLFTRGLPDGDSLIVLTWVVQGVLLIVIAGALWWRRPNGQQK